MTLANRTLVIMAKAPRPGSVKTRLAESLSLQEVNELYRCLLNDTIALAQALDRVEFAIMCPASDVDDLARGGQNSAHRASDGPRPGRRPCLRVQSLCNLWPTAGHCLQQRQPTLAGISIGDRVRHARSPRPGCRTYARRRLLSCRCEGVPFRSIRQ